MSEASLSNGTMVGSVSVRFKNARVETMSLNIRIQWSAGNGQVSLIFGVPNFCAFSLLFLCLFKVQVEAKKRKN